MNPWKTNSVKQVYDNAWIQVTHCEVINPKGGEGIYGVVHFKNLAMGIVPLDADLNTWLVGQYRYTMNEYTWEIPEGGALLGSSPLEAAKRELIEETGIRAARWTKILDLQVSNSVTNERGMAFLAQELAFGEAEPEDTEELKIKKLPFDEVYQMVIDGRITDSLSVAAIFKVKHLLDQAEI